MANVTRKKMYNLVAKELGYDSYVDDWGNEHLVNGSHGDYFFDSTSGEIWQGLINLRLLLANKKTAAQRRQPCLNVL